MRLKLILAGLLAAALLAPAGAHAQNAYVRAKKAGLWAGPDTDYPRIAKLYRGEPLNVYGCLPGWGWCDVSWRGYRGWMTSENIGYLYRGQWESIPSYGPRYGVPVITFSFNYWDEHYRDRDFYRERERWEHRHPEYRRDRRHDDRRHDRHDRDWNHDRDHRRGDIGWDRRNRDGGDRDRNDDRRGGDDGHDRWRRDRYVVAPAAVSREPERRDREGHDRNGVARRDRAVPPGASGREARHEGRANHRRSDGDKARGGERGRDRVANDGDSRGKPHRRHD